MGRSALTALARRLLEVNQRAARRIERRLPAARRELRADYVETVARHMNARPGPTLVVDLGSGRECAFARRRVPGRAITVVGVDASDEELRFNADIDERRVADVARGLPFGDGEVSVLASSSVLEHLPDTGALVAETARILAPGGHAIHMFPSKRSPFALANRLLPRGLAERLLRIFMPWSRGGFEAHYDHCTAAAMSRLHREHGLEVVEVRAGYYQAEYFAPALPLYLLAALWDSVVHALDVRPLAATVLLVARRPG
jgi:SAM-dependent methyltransferase